MTRETSAYCACYSIMKPKRLRQCRSLSRAYFILSTKRNRRLQRIPPNPLRSVDEFRRKTFTSEEAAEDFEYRCTTDDVENDYLHQEKQSLQSAQVAYLMQHLTRRQRQAITLYYIEQRKYEEICDIMQMNYHSVRNLMHRGMLKLREAAM